MYDGVIIKHQGNIKDSLERINNSVQIEYPTITIVSKNFDTKILDLMKTEDFIKKYILTINFYNYETFKCLINKNLVTILKLWTT